MFVIYIYLYYYLKQISIFCRLRLINPKFLQFRVFITFLIRNSSMVNIHESKPETAERHEWRVIYVSGKTYWLSHLYSYYLRQLLDSTLNPWILFYQLSDLDVLIGNGTTETGYVVATSKMAARKMVLQYLLTIN